MRETIREQLRVAHAEIPRPRRTRIAGTTHRAFVPSVLVLVRTIAAHASDHVEPSAWAAGAGGSASTEADQRD
jgi:hypothetical protein